MKTRTPLKRTKPMSRSSASTLKQSTFTRRKPKKRAGHDKTMLAACRGEPCYLRMPGICTGASGEDTVVPCHSNEGAHGKGMGKKADDMFTVPGCAHCHAQLDQGNLFTKQQKFSFWRAAYLKWIPVRTAKMARKP